MRPVIPTRHTIAGIAAQHVPYVHGLLHVLRASVTFSWRQLQQTALAVWQCPPHRGPTYRGSLHFCRPEFYCHAHPTRAASPLCPLAESEGIMAA